VRAVRRRDGTTADTSAEEEAQAASRAGGESIAA
jgi:hypothetical protein